MKDIIAEIERSVGDLLAVQGLTAVYDATDYPDSEDDIVHFVDGEGRKSVVSIQVSSLRPSLDGASVGVSFLNERQLADGWRYVEFEGVTGYPEAGSRDAFMRHLIKALEENAGSFDFSEGGPGVVTHPLLGEALKAVDAFAEDTGTEVTVRGFRLDDKEGLEVADGDGRTVRIEATPGTLAVIAAGERNVIGPRASGERIEILKNIMADAMPSAGLRI